MIKNIQQLKKFGIFKDCNNKEVNDFGKNNLLYGWNGSGKTTLSMFFGLLEKKVLPPKFPNAEFIINLENNKITQTNFNSSNLNIHVFNEDFVKENIDWDNSIKSILLVAKEKIDERKKLDQLNAENIKEEKNFDKNKSKIESLEKSASKFMTDSAKRIKTSLQSIDTSDSYYLNYNKKKLEDFINTNKSKINDESSFLENSTISEYINSAKPNQKPEITFNQKAIDGKVFVSAKKRLDDLMETNILNKSIQHLANNSDIQSWVESGIEIHKKHETSICEYCGNTISEQRIKDIEAHFSNDYKEFKERLNKTNEWLNDFYFKLDELPSQSSFYDEFRNDYDVACTKLKTLTESVNKEIDEWVNVLKKKNDDAFNTSLLIESVDELLIEGINLAIASVSSIVELHNNKTANFEAETKKSKKLLELHYAATEVKDFEYYDKLRDINNAKEIDAAFKIAIDLRSIEIQTLESSLSNEGLGAGEFNRSLHKFIGRSELSLQFNKNIKGYEIIRNNAGSHDGNLSEGEKTAIAFIYFITKLTENNNKVKNAIIVVDDPVSSFDSNNLFHAYSFLRQHCSDAKQLFVLTHNFTYFKLVRDWFEGNNKNRRGRKPPKPENSFFYTIESSSTNPRCSELVNADSTLIDYNSEYHYLFSKLLRYKDSTKLNRDEAFLTANISRKLLESFFSFKYPKQRSDLNQLLSVGLTGCNITTPETKEKIYRFINKYSHSDVIEINEDSSENLIGESYSVIGDIFEWVNEVDPVHYSEMVLVSNE